MSNRARDEQLQDQQRQTRRAIPPVTRVELELNRRVREQTQELIERYLREQPEVRERFELFGAGLGGLLGLS